MSSSEPNSKIEFIESAQSIRKKISSAYAKSTNPSNTLFLQYVIFPVNKLKCVEKFTISRDVKYGGNIEYTNLLTIIQDYQIDKLTPQDLKIGISDWLVNFLEPIRNLLNDEEFINVSKLAYGI
jgi:tyrosyl-tRNA synthetase